VTLRTTTNGAATVNPEVFWVPITAENKPPPMQSVRPGADDHLQFKSRGF